MFDATFAAPDLSSFTGLDGLGLAAVGQRIEPGRAVIACRVVADDDWCRRCGCQGVPRDSVVRRLAHAPLGWRPTTLHVVLRRYSCSGCGHVWRQDISTAAAPRAKLTKAALRWALEGLVIHKLTIARVADGLDVAWHTANDAVLAEGKRVLIADPARFDGVRVLGVDEHVWRHTRHGDKYVTVIIDLTPVRDRTGPARLLDMVEGRSKAVFKDWLTERPKAWRKRVDVVAMVPRKREVAAYRDHDRPRARASMQAVIDAVNARLPADLVELRRLGRTLKQRSADILAFFDLSHTSNGPTEAINGRLEHLRGSALGFRNLTNYIARSLLETGGFRPRLHPQMR